MSKYENALKLMEERCGNGKDNLISLATIARYPNAEGKPRPAARMVDAYYEDGMFYISTYAKGNKMQQIEQNNEVSIAGMDWFVSQGIGENLGWVKDQRNAEILVKMKKYFAGWFNDHGNEDDPDSCVLRIKLTDATITDNEKKYGEWQYKVDFVNKTAT